MVADPRALFRLGKTAIADRAAIEIAGTFGLGSNAALFITTVAAALFVATLLLPAAAAAVYVRLRRLQREKSLREATLEGTSGSEGYLGMLRSALDYRFADVGFHLKYAEALVARGRHADAAVEARLILVQDPYNFNGNLLLANLYYTLGLYDDCAVCERYLAVSGCFGSSPSCATSVGQGPVDSLTPGRPVRRRPAMDSPPWPAVRRPRMSPSSCSKPRW